MKYRDGLSPAELAEHDRCEAAYVAARDASRAELAAIKEPMTALRMRGYQRLQRKGKNDVAED